GFCLGLCWNIEVLTTRREGFPSWSWTGWHGQIEWAFTQEEWMFYEGNKDMKLQVELQSGQLIAWDKFQETYIQESPHMISTLHIAAKVIPLRILGSKKLHAIDGEEQTRIIARVEATDGRSLHWSFRQMTNDSAHLSAKWTAVPLAQERHFKLYSGGLWVMVLYETSPGLYQRACIDRMERDNLEDPDHESEEAEGYDTEQTPPDLERKWEEFRLS
ncbi:hypothetical protein M426DRAFT_28568, partial [Hypoxylon sp. CI-4A]